MARLKLLAQDIWTAEGPTVSFFGVPYPTRMVMIRLEGGLWIWSPIALDHELRSELAPLGPVRWLVEPNQIHHIFLGSWISEFDEAEVFAPPGLAARKPGVPFAGELGDTPPQPWAGVIDQVVFRGSPVMEEVVFFHRPSSTCIVGDLIQRHNPDDFSAWLRPLMRADGLLGERGSTPREWRATFVRRGAARAALRTALAWNPQRLVIAHGRCADSDGRRVLEQSLAWIDRPWPL